MNITKLENNLVKISTSKNDVFWGDNSFNKNDQQGIFLHQNFKKDIDKFTEKEFHISWPGEFEISGISISSFLVSEKLLVFKIFAKNLRTLLLSQINKPFSEKEIDKFGNIDGIIFNLEKISISRKILKQFIEDIEPRFVIFLGDQAKLSEIQNELNISSDEIVSNNEIEISPKNLNSEKTKYFQL